MRIGLDIGSTTMKVAVIDNGDRLLFTKYERHYSQIVHKMTELLTEVRSRFPDMDTAYLAVSGSAGMGLADGCGIPFVQEVYATRIAAERLMPDTDVIIELGGEDAKILFLQGLTDARMNGTCAGGTGAFIDQMATLLNVTPDDLNEMAKRHEKIYTIASRCGVFAKSDIQALLNQGAQDSDIAASVFSAVVNQTVAGLAQGRPIQGRVLYLGGPLTFLSELRASFDETLDLNGVCPENSLFYVAMGTAYSAGESLALDALLQKLGQVRSVGSFVSMEPLFADKAEYAAFQQRHARARVPAGSLAEHLDGVYIGVDAGSTTVKFAAVAPDGALLHARYQSNSGNPVPLIRQFLTELYELAPGIRILGSAVTGYGEDLIRNAFCFDYGLVETVAHCTAARWFKPEVDFILDIGGQDIKCLKVRDGVIDNIYLNEACSSGCGSFLQTFANALGYSIADFAKLGLFADRPVDLGSRCTVFMNSSVKQAQKDGASMENISAGLSMSVVRNAIYKVIRPSSTEELGKHIVVQGGTFYNDAVLRAFEKELGLEVVRPDIAGLMGAYGAALFARSRRAETPGESTTLPAAALSEFQHDVKVANCRLCSNNCRLTINQFSGGRRYISGNRCERPITKKEPDDRFNLYGYKRALLREYRKPADGGKPVVGLPMGLNLYELLPFWHGFFTALGFDVAVSPVSDRRLYLRGQSTIPSDTVCFPAKLTHGHMQALIDQGVTTIFYPCMSYNLNEEMGDNCYNCPVVAYYPEVLGANMPDVEKITFINGYLGIHQLRTFPTKLWELLRPHFPTLTRRQVKQAVQAAFASYNAYMEKVRRTGRQMIEDARASGMPILVLAGRPYHIDPEINHGIDKLIAGMGLAVVSEDAVSPLFDGKLDDLQVLNQWTYHSRLYAAAKYVATQPDMQLVQLVSFGCGCDAITTDECRRILEQAGKIYTQIKIDEIENLGAAKIRLRSLFAAAGLEQTDRASAAGEPAKQAPKARETLSVK